MVSALVKPHAVTHDGSFVMFIMLLGVSHHQMSGLSLVLKFQFNAAFASVGGSVLVHMSVINLGAVAVAIRFGVAKP